MFSNYNLKRGNNLQTNPLQMAPNNSSLAYHHNNGFDPYFHKMKTHPVPESAQILSRCGIDPDLYHTQMSTRVNPSGWIDLANCRATFIPPPPNWLGDRHNRWSCNRETIPPYTVQECLLNNGIQTYGRNIELNCRNNAILDGFIPPIEDYGYGNRPSCCGYPYLTENSSNCLYRDSLATERGSILTSIPERQQVCGFTRNQKQSIINQWIDNQKKSNPLRPQINTKQSKSRKSNTIIKPAKQPKSEAFVKKSKPIAKSQSSKKSIPSHLNTNKNRI